MMATVARSVAEETAVAEAAILETGPRAKVAAVAEARIMRLSASRGAHVRHLPVADSNGGREESNVGRAAGRRSQPPRPSQCVFDKTFLRNERRCFGPVIQQIRRGPPGFVEDLAHKKAPKAKKGIHD